jgi:DNA-binding Lrp family transcriptional regulator
MQKALVFINSRSDTADVVDDLKKVSGVTEAYASRGMYDAVVMVQGNSLMQVQEIISRRIRMLAGVKSTLTLTLVESPAT